VHYCQSYWLVTSLPLCVTRRYIASIHNSLPPFPAFSHANEWFTASPRYVGAPGRLIIWHPLKTTFFKVFQPVNRTRNFEGARAQTADNFRRNSYAYRNPSLPAQYSRLLQWPLGAPHGLAPRAAAQLADRWVDDILICGWCSLQSLRTKGCTSHFGKSRGPQDTGYIESKVTSQRPQA
jgi:hypothetical protein